nr:hypothetical protein [uncultured Undibacterium sp.]
MVFSKIIDNYFLKSFANRRGAENAEEISYFLHACARATKTLRTLRLCGSSFF